MSSRIPKKTVNLTVVGERLRLARVTTLLNQEDFGALAGVTRNSQALYEGGKSPFGIDYLLRLQEHGVDIGYIVTGVRQDGSLSFEQQQFIDLFEKLPFDQQSTIFDLLSHLTGSYADLGQMSAVERHKLHSPTMSYKAPPEDL